MANKKKIEFYKQVKTEKPAPAAGEQNKEVVSDLAKLEMLVGEYWRQILLGIGVVIVAVIALIVIQMVNEKAELELVQEFAKADTVEELNAVIRDNADHKAGILARMKLAQKYIEAGNDTAAYSALREVYGMKDADSFLRIQAGLQSAYLMEKAGKLKEAIADFTEVSNDPQVREIQRQEALYAAARIYIREQDLPAAKSLLNRINYDSPAANIWTEKCARLKNEVENPAALNVAPVTETAPAK